MSDSDDNQRDNPKGFANNPKITRPVVVTHKPKFEPIQGSAHTVNAILGASSPEDMWSDLASERPTNGAPGSRDR